MDHRRTVTGKSLTLSGWVIIFSAAVCLGAAILYAVLLLGDGETRPAAPQSPATTMAPTPSATPTATPTPSDTPTATASTPPTDDAEARRDLPVDVFNNTSTAGLARTVADKAAAAGWTIHATGNWRGSIPAWTVYYPAGFEAQAHILASDVGAGRVRAAVAPMSTERLTLILSGQQ